MVTDNNAINIECPIGTNIKKLNARNTCSDHCSTDRFLYPSPLLLIPAFNWAYNGIATNLSGLTVEFDSYKNPEYNDINANHIGVQTNMTGFSSKSVDISPIVSNLNYGQTLWSWIDYDGTSSLSVYLSSNSTKPLTPILQTTLNLCSLWPPNSGLRYPGFAASGASKCFTFFPSLCFMLYTEDGCTDKGLCGAEQQT